MKRYPYAGPHAILRRSLKGPAGVPVCSVADLEDWLHRTGSKPNRLGQFVLTFVIDEAALLRVADRGSEHVACAGGGPVLSAGELFIVCASDGPCVVEVSNQSVGYCPEPLPGRSWPRHWMRSAYPIPAGSPSRSSSASARPAASPTS
jgi:hypothetical protein